MRIKRLYTLFGESFDHLIRDIIRNTKESSHGDDEPGL